MRKKKEVRILTAVDANVISHVLLGQLSRVGGDLDLAQGDIARLKLAKVLLLVEGLDRLKPLGVVLGLEKVEAVDTLALEIVDAHASNALAGLVEGSDDVGHSGALRVDRSRLGLVGDGALCGRRHV